MKKINVLRVYVGLLVAAVLINLIHYRTDCQSLFLSWLLAFLLYCVRRFERILDSDFVLQLYVEHRGKWEWERSSNSEGVWSVRVVKVTGRLTHTPISSLGCVNGLQKTTPFQTNLKFPSKFFREAGFMETLSCGQTEWLLFPPRNARQQSDDYSVILIGREICFMV